MNNNTVAILLNSECYLNINSQYYLNSGSDGKGEWSEILRAYVEG